MTVLMILERLKYATIILPFLLLVLPVFATCTLKLYYEFYTYLKLLCPLDQLLFYQHKMTLFISDIDFDVNVAPSSLFN